MLSNSVTDSRNKESQTENQLTKRFPQNEFRRRFGIFSGWRRHCFKTAAMIYWRPYNICVISRNLSSIFFLHNLNPLHGPTKNRLFRDANVDSVDIIVCVVSRLLHDMRSRLYKLKIYWINKLVDLLAATINTFSCSRACAVLLTNSLEVFENLKSKVSPMFFTILLRFCFVCTARHWMSVLRWFRRADVQFRIGCVFPLLPLECWLLPEITFNCLLP